MAGRTSVPIAQLAVAIIFSIPTLFIFIRHGGPGLLGWFYLFAFCTLLIIGAALQINAENKGTSTSSSSLISNIGLSPLLLATSGVLHEARNYRNPTPRKCCEWTLVGVVHLLVATGIALVACGASALYDGTANTGQLNLVKVGVILLLITYVLVAAWAFYSMLPTQSRKDAAGHHDGSLLLYGVILSLPFTGIRVLYSVVALLSESPKLNPATGVLGLTVGLNLVPQLISILIFIVAGWVTLGIRRSGGMVVDDRRRTHSSRSRRSRRARTSV
ncbi:MAG: hypothetical protein M4579_001620 [Chaenotheca gracillima]|nr:MAG: hypothetical protein M4579_001620 [Chaenotheca gracillima]